MRIIRFLFTSLILCTVVGGFGVLLGREFLVIQATNQMKNSLREVAQVARSSGVYATECRKKGITGLDTSSIKLIQLRFTSSRDYQIEVICEQFSLDPIVVSNYTLPRFVSKIPGYSGIIWGDALSGIAVESFGRKKSIFVESTTAEFGTEADLQGAIGPVTTCQGNGFSCCEADTSFGQGQQINNVTDCVSNCYAACVKRPVVLSLSTQPVYDFRTRVLNLRKNDQVTMAYVIDPAGSMSLDVSIDFGDGTVEKKTTATGEVSHSYQCSQATCQYNLHLTAINETGVAAADTAVTSISVVVQ